MIAKYDKTKTELEHINKREHDSLNNLKANPEKEYILWPDRLKKVEAFETHLQRIYSE